MTQVNPKIKIRIYAQHIEVKLSILEYPAREASYKALVNSPEFIAALMSL